MGGRWGKFGTSLSAELIGLVGSGQRIRHCHTVDVRCLQVEGRRQSVFPWRIVSRGTDRSCSCAALVDEVHRPDEWHSMDTNNGHTETNYEVLFRSDRWQPERIKPVPI